MTQSVFRPDLLRGKSVFIAGGTSGINLGIAEAYIDAGASVAVAGRNPEKAENAANQLCARGGEAIGVSLDVRDYASVEAGLELARNRFGEFDIVISGAAGNFLAPALGMSANGFRTVIDIDLNGTFNIFRAAYALLRKPGASLIAISAGQATNPMMFQAHVCAAKAGINMLVKVLAMEWGPAGVRVNVISPGPIGGTEGMARLTPTAEDEASWKARIALRGFGQKSDVSDMAMFLASDASAYVTGSIFQCDGGWTLGDSSGEAPGIETQ